MTAVRASATSTTTVTTTPVAPSRVGEFVREGSVQVAAVVVTYNSGATIDALIESLRPEAVDTTMRVIVADNASTDDTLDRLARHADVVVISTGGNLGYAGGINAAAAEAGAYGALLVLNPDLRVERGAVQALLDALRRDPSSGAAVPRILDRHGRTAESLFSEPTALRAWCDAVLGPLWRNRPGALTEWIRDPQAYDSPRCVDWATGAALLVSSAAARAVGEWDERFFLYSEETDYCRRIRDAGLHIRYQPAAIVHHSQGGSGASEQLDALLNVNRVRYMRKHAPRSAASYRMAVTVGALLRGRRASSQATVARYLRDERRWAELPQGTWLGSRGRTSAAVVIPAHDEERVISRTLGRLSEPIALGALETVVVCNGCSDRTADRAREIAGVRVVELSEPSKTGALNAGDAEASAWPRVYLDADIEFPSAAVPALVRALGADGVLAARPPFEYDSLGATALVRAYFRARARLPHLAQSLWGAGTYALNAAGHGRLGRFPEVIADDVHVDQLFRAEEKRIPLAPPVRVRTPRRAADLLRVLVRTRRGPAQQGLDSGRATARALLRSVRGPQSLWDASVFASVTLLARSRASRSRARAARWERDDSTR